MDEKRKKLKEALDAKKISLAEASRKIGRNPAYIQQYIERGTPRVLPEKLRLALAALTGMSDTDFAGGDHATVSLMATGYLSVLGEVRAGVWIEENAVLEDSSEVIPIGADPDYAYAEQFALRVIGTSMNRVAQPGEYVLVARWADIGRMPRDGEVLLIRREKAGEFEVTLKRAKKLNGIWEMWPDSTDPRYQTPLKWSGKEEDMSVTILGKAIGYYRKGV